MNEYFRIIRGLELDDTVRILHGAGAPGSTSDTDTAQVGSFYLDTTNGTAYSKKTAGSGAVHWGSVNQSLYTERNVAGTPPATGADNSIALGSGAATAAGIYKNLGGTQGLTNIGNWLTGGGGANPAGYGSGADASLFW